MNKIRGGKIAADKHRHLVALILFILLSCSGERPAMAAEQAADVAVEESIIKFSQNEFPRVANLCVELRNNTDKTAANLDLEIRYNDADGYLIRKTVLKNKLTEAIPPRESRKYKIPLKGDVFNERNEEYPYARSSEVGHFEVKVLKVKFSR